MVPCWHEVALLKKKDENVDEKQDILDNNLSENQNENFDKEKITTQKGDEENSIITDRLKTQKSNTVKNKKFHENFEQKQKTTSSKKTGLFYVSTTNYGIENPLIHLTDTALRKITKQMYEQLEEVMNQLQNEEVA